MPTHAASRTPHQLSTTLLLKTPCFGKRELLEAMNSLWALTPDELETDLLENPIAPLVFTLKKILVAVVFVPSTLPGNLALDIARETGITKNETAQHEAIARAHQGYALINVSGPVPMKALAQVASKINAAAMSLANASAIMLPWAFFAKDDYLKRVHPALHQDSLPVSAWVTVSVSADQEGLNLYTTGLSEFHFPELEMLHLNASQTHPQEAYSLLMTLATLLLTETRKIPLGEVLSLEGETLTKVRLTKAPGVMVEGKSLQIEALP